MTEKTSKDSKERILKKKSQAPKYFNNIVKSQI